MTQIKTYTFVFGVETNFYVPKTFEGTYTFAASTRVSALWKEILSESRSPTAARDFLSKGQGPGLLSFKKNVFSQLEKSMAVCVAEAS